MIVVSVEMRRDARVPRGKGRPMSVCFVICAIGQKDTETRRLADDLLEEIATALEPFNMEAMRGDHNLDTKQVDADIIERIQNAELCIADLSEDNVNVYYELGRRDETGKPIILVRRHGLPPLPVDIAGRRYIEYEIETRRGARLFRDQLREAIQSVSSNGFEGENGNATLAGVYQVLQRVDPVQASQRCALRVQGSAAAQTDQNILRGTA